MRLLYGEASSVEDIIKEYRIETKAIMKDVAEICWFMRGGITWDQGMNLTHKQRKVIKEVINDNIERVKQTGLALL